MKYLQRYGVILTLPLFILLLAACGSQEPPPPTPATVEEVVDQALPQLPFVGTSWQLESIGEVDDNIQPMEGTDSTVSFGLDRYSGSGGCNYFLGVYTVDAAELGFTTPATTAFTCATPEGLMQQEATYLSALVNVTEYREEEGKLLAYTVEDQLLLTFVPAEDVPFEGTTWLLKFQNGEGGPAPVIPDTELTALFEDGVLSGSAGCNTYTATYELDGEKLVLSDLAYTEMACEDPVGIMDQESTYLAVLQTVVGRVQAGGALDLTDVDGRLVLLFGAP